MYRKVDDFLQDWQYESQSTIKVLKNLTDESLKHNVTEESRSLGFLAWHLIMGMEPMATSGGITLDAPAQGTPIPGAGEIVETYEKAVNSLADEVKNNWNDDTLLEEFNMFGQQMTKGKLLSLIILHQAHHRGQMSVLMRQAGVRVPGVYGPAKEEWEAMGIPAMQ